MNFGTVTLRDGWKIKCEPHVAIRIKRHFARMDKAQYGTLTLSDTPEMARELEWFLSRYPLAMGESDAAHLARRAAEHREREALVDRLLSSQQCSLPFEMARPAREYQKVAAALLLAKGSLLLADDVGIGKTCSAICAFTDPRTLPALFVTLAHLPKQIEGEIAKCIPQLTTHILRKGTPYDIPASWGMFGKFPDVVITNYHKLSGWAETLAPIIRSVVFDECQELRHARNNQGRTLKYAAAKHLADHAAFRCGLSATPFYNFGGELFNVMEVLSPGELGKHDEFVREWCSYSFGDGKERIKDPKAFGQYLRSSGLMLRRTRKEVNRELPAAITVPQYIDADEKALDDVSDACAELARVILRQGQEHPGQKMQASEELSYRLRQATGIAKAPYVAAFVKLLLESEKQVLLYGWHRAVYEIWMDRLREFNPVLYTGSESASRKEAAKDQFLSGESRVLIISLRSGAGVDGLQDVAHVAVFGELDWSPGVHEQNIGRLHRDGQEEPVIAYFLIAETGSDPVVADVLGLKKEQIEGVRDPNQDLVTKLQTDTGNARRLAEAYLGQRGQPEAGYRDSALGT